MDSRGFGHGAPIRILRAVVTDATGLCQITTMGSDSKLFLMDADPDPGDAAAWTLRESLYREGGWIEVPADGDVAAEELSRRLQATVVSFDIQTTVDQIWIVCFEDGEKVRELHYVAEEGWSKESGPARPFEDGRQLKRWRSQRYLLASPDGYDVLEAFLGRTRKKAPQNGLTSLTASQLEHVREWLGLGGETDGRSFEVEVPVKFPGSGGTTLVALTLSEHPKRLRQQLASMMEALAKVMGPTGPDLLGAPLRNLSGSRETERFRARALETFEKENRALQKRILANTTKVLRRAHRIANTWFAGQAEEIARATMRYFSGVRTQREALRTLRSKSESSGLAARFDSPEAGALQKTVVELAAMSGSAKALPQKKEQELLTAYLKAGTMHLVVWRLLEPEVLDAARHVEQRRFARAVVDSLRQSLLNLDVLEQAFAANPDEVWNYPHLIDQALIALGVEPQTLISKMVEYRLGLVGREWWLKGTPTSAQDPLFQLIKKEPTRELALEYAHSMAEEAAGWRAFLAYQRRPVAKAGIAPFDAPGMPYARASTLLPLPFREERSPGAAFALAALHVVGLRKAPERKRKAR